MEQSRQTEGKRKLELILQQAAAEGASDVHLTVGIAPRMRKCGRLTGLPFETLTAEDTEAMAASVLNPKQWEQFAAMGECDLSLSLPGIGRYRLNVFRQQSAAALAFRLVADQVPSPQSLGLPASVMELYQRKRGLVLVTGPTGSGKSTTLASIIDQINSQREAHIITLEDPVEYLHLHKKSMVNQREIGLDTKSYANALRAALREDPDVILVGEMRDFETISVAVTAAETGHLVLSTLHTIGAANTVDRIIDVFEPHQQQQIRVQLSNVLEAVISQQLIPRADGNGRVAAFEVLHANLAVRNLIREGKTYQISSIMQTNRRQGMIVMDEAIIQLARDGQITPKDALAFAQDAEAMVQKL